LNAVTFRPPLYVAVGESGAIITSTDATHWTRRSAATSSYSLNDVIYTNNYFIAVGSVGTILYSLDGFQWSPLPTASAASLYAVTYANGTYVAVGQGGTVVFSTNATSWTRADVPISLDLYDITYGAGTFVIVGARGAILQSRDFFRPSLTAQLGSGGVEIVVPPTEFNRTYRLQSANDIGFAVPTVLATFSNSHAATVYRDEIVLGSRRFYRAVTP
jgi:hypothetical protein